MQLKIKEVKEGKSGTNAKGVKWVQYQVIFEDGQKVSTFDHKIATLGGKTIEAELIQEGQYTNLGKWELIEDKPALSHTPLTPAAPVPAPSREASIEAQVAVKEIGEALRAKIEVKPEYVALYWGWIGHALAGILPPAPKPATTAKEKASTKVTDEAPNPDNIPF